MGPPPSRLQASTKKAPLFLTISFYSRSFSNRQMYNRLKKETTRTLYYITIIYLNKTVELEVGPSSTYGFLSKCLTDHVSKLKKERIYMRKRELGQLLNKLLYLSSSFSLFSTFLTALYNTSPPFQPQQSLSFLPLIAFIFSTSGFLIPFSFIFFLATYALVCCYSLLGNL